ncbi:hypothetical protein MBLNU230_g1238t1 [Neophaeotheca triangularis]
MDGTSSSTRYEPNPGKNTRGRAYAMAEHNHLQAQYHCTPLEIIPVELRGTHALTDAFIHYLYLISRRVPRLDHLQDLMHLEVSQRRSKRPRSVANVAANDMRTILGKVKTAHGRARARAMVEDAREEEESKEEERKEAEVKGGDGEGKEAEEAEEAESEANENAVEEEVEAGTTRSGRNFT